LFALKGGRGRAGASISCAGHTRSVAQPTGGMGGWGPTGWPPWLAQHTLYPDRDPYPVVENLPPWCVKNPAIGVDAGMVDWDQVVWVVGGLVLVLRKVATAARAAHEPRDELDLAGGWMSRPVGTTPATEPAHLELAEDDTRRRHRDASTALRVEVVVDVATHDGVALGERP